MRETVRRVVRALGRAAGAAPAILASLAEEFWIAVAVILIGAGFWMTWRPGAYFFAGAVVLWLALPARAPFIAAPPMAERKGRKAE